MAKRKSGQSSQVEAVPADAESANKTIIWRNFKEAHNILDTNFEGVNLGDGPTLAASKSKAADACKRAHGWIETMENCTRDISNENTQYLISMATVLLVLDLTLAAPSSKASIIDHQEYHRFRKILKSSGMNQARATKSESRAKILDQVILSVFGDKIPESLNSSKKQLIISQTRKRMSSQEKTKYANWPSRQTVERRFKKLFQDRT